MANRLRLIGIVVLIITCFSSVGLYLFGRDPYAEQQITQLVQAAYNGQRPGGGRLSGASYTPTLSAPVRSDLGKAQIVLLGQPASEVHQRLQGLVYLAAGDWQKFIDAAGHAPLQSRNDPALLNNLGASFLAVSDKDPASLLMALDAFERASQLAPNAPEPLFNLVVTYRKLRLRQLVEESLGRFMALEADSAWSRELLSDTAIDESATLEHLKLAIETNKFAEAEQLFQVNAELCRRVALEYATLNQAEPDALLHFIADQMERRYRDKTVSSMIAPLFTDQRETIVALREFVNRGGQLYLDGKYRESLSAYAEASKLADKTDSAFDHLWIDLNAVNTQIRLGKFDAVRQSLAHLILTANEHGFIWLEAKALSIYGSTVRLTSSYGEMMDLLWKAERTFTEIDAPHDRIRALYYLAAYRYYGGDQDAALGLALECLSLVNDDDPVRIATLDWLIGSILYRRGMQERSVLFAKESVERSRNGPYAGGVEFTSATALAEMYESMSKHKLADQYLEIADDAFQKIPRGFDRDRNELQLALAKAKNNINQKRYDEAESQLQRNLAVYGRQPFQATRLLSQSLMTLARLYSETGRIGEAARKFNEAIGVIENDDEYLKSEGFRVKFDDERRELYDSAIEFEFSRGSADAAWTYLQKYQAKLFLEFLAAFNPGIDKTVPRLDQAAVRQRIPKDTQIIEYALLKDRLLIWLVTDKVFTVRSVAVSRAVLEDKIQTVLQKLRSGDEADPLLLELGTVLVEPVSKLLDPDRTLAIIPDRALHGLPFAALRRTGSKRYLIEDFAIVVSPSLTHFLTANAAQPRRDSIVAFGSQNGGSSELRELKALRDIYPQAKTFDGPQVGKSSFLAAMPQAAVFHYAGHSATDAIDPLRSSILLDGNRSGPNSVTAIDISQRRLANNAVVILSSCDSSVGNSRDGVGVRGLTSAFLIGGAGSVVGSLWPVEASSTADLMIRFHRAFAHSGMPVANALRQAQLTFLQSFPERAHPYYWSGFVVTGNFSALR